MRRIALGAALLVPVALQPQEMRGRVLTTDGRELAYARVALLADSVRSGARLAQVDADEAGRFVVRTVPASTRYVWVGRVGFEPIVIPLPRAGDSIVVALEELRVAQARRDSIAYSRHLARVAVARSRPRHWVCTLGDSVARRRARAAYYAFVAADTNEMGRVGLEHGVPRDSVSFTRMFVRPLTAAECQRFAEGLDRRSSGLETDTVEVYRFGSALYLPWYGGYEGGFADMDGKVLTVFIVPD